MELDVALGLLDRQLVDPYGERCGRVDDVEIEGEPGRGARAVALISGSSAAARRAPLLVRPLARLGFGDRPSVRISWDQIEQLSRVVKLRESAESLRLSQGERKAMRLLSKVTRK